MEYRFTNSWFDSNLEDWSKLLQYLKPEKILEVGSYEGKSIVYMIETVSKHCSVEIYSVDTWEGGVERKEGTPESLEMLNVESRFQHNINVAISKSKFKPTVNICKGPSNRQLPKLIANGMENYFDLVYIDGSHEATDALIDIVLGFELLRVGGIMVMDDYLWRQHLPEVNNPIHRPKISIDAFTNIYCKKIKFHKTLTRNQIFVEKV